MEIPYYNTILDRFFTILELAPTASFDEVKRKYHSLAFKYHPDLNQETEEKMKDINEAYSILKSNETRISYVKKYGVYTSNTYLDGKTYKQEELERLKQTLVQIKKSYQNVKEQESKISFKQRFKDNYHFLEEDEYFAPLVDKGIRITYAILLETIYQLKKLKRQSNDNFSKYTLRNRKTLAGIIIATMLFNQTGINVEANNAVKQPTQTQKQTTTSSSKLLIDQQLVMKTYEPEPEETLEIIAEKFNISIEKLKEVNNIKYNIKEKTIIKIPYYIDFQQIDAVTSTVNFNDFNSLEDIAKLFNTDLRTIVSLNIKSFEYIDGEYTLTTNIIIVPDFEKISNLVIQKVYQKS